MKDNGIIGGIVVLLLVVGGILFFVSGKSNVPPSVSTGDVGTPSLAQCLKDSGTIFYGAFWCPHCKSQKALFGSAQKVLPYVECSTADGNGQNKICVDKQIKSYPTWVFPDGTQLTGEVPLDTLATKSGCAVVPTPSDASLSASTSESNLIIGSTTPL